MDKELIKAVQQRMELKGFKKWDDPQAVLELGVQANLIKAYSLNRGTAEVLWKGDTLLRYMDMEVATVVLKEIVKQLPPIENAKSKLSSEKSDTVPGAEVK
jgi:hypothetical protein